MLIANNMKKTTQGRKKIEIKKIEQVNNRQVTFSKRRGGLFKKASELCILSGAETAIIVRSPSGHVFSFGHQSADAVIHKYVNGSSSSEVPTKSNLPPMYDEFNKQYEKISKELEEEKKRSVMIEEAKSVGNRGVWWNERVDDLGLEDLEQFVAALEELKKKVDTRADELMMMNASTMPLTSILAMNQTTDCGSDMVSHGFDFGDGQF